MASKIHRGYSNWFLKLIAYARLGGIDLFIIPAPNLQRPNLIHKLQSLMPNQGEAESENTQK